jgi:hypothetical protein
MCRMIFIKKTHHIAYEWEFLIHFHPIHTQFYHNEIALGWWDLEGKYLGYYHSSG